MAIKSTIKSMEGVKEKLEALKGPRGYTIESLGLNVEAAEAGKTWLLLPERFRYDSFGPIYPLVGKPQELRRLACIPVPPGKTDGGAVYLRRCFNAWRKKAALKGSLLNDLGRTGDKLRQDTAKLEKQMQKMVQEAQNAVDDVRQQAAASVATLTDLFSLSRKGLKQQMDAYMANQPLNGEEITHAAFRDCVKIVTQAVKGLGLPDGERKNASEAVVEQMAEALRAAEETRETLNLTAKPQNDDETTH